MLIILSLPVQLILSDITHISKRHLVKCLSAIEVCLDSCWISCSICTWLLWINSCSKWATFHHYSTTFLWSLFHRMNSTTCTIGTHRLNTLRMLQSFIELLLLLIIYMPLLKLLEELLNHIVFCILLQLALLCV